MIDKIQGYLDAQFPFKAKLELDDNKAYRIPKTDENGSCIQNGYTLDTQVRLGKYR